MGGISAMEHLLERSEFPRLPSAYLIHLLETAEKWKALREKAREGAGWNSTLGFRVRKHSRVPGGTAL
jgi:hypothetical protein